MPDRRLDDLLDSWELSLRASNKAPRTIETYRLAAKQLVDHLTDQGHSLRLGDISPDDLRGYIAWVVEHRSPSTAAQRYASLQQLFKWCVEEEEIDRSPMDRLKKPTIPDKPIPVLTDDQLRALLDAAAYRSDMSGQTAHEALRDTAILRLFIDTPSRLSEVSERVVDDVDIRGHLIRIVSKGRHERAVRFGDKTAVALDRYLRRARPQMRDADGPWLWLGYRGRLTRSGIAQMLRRRAEQAGIGHVHPHQFRHTFAHRWLADGGSEGALQSLAGWRDRQMLARYASSEAARRALEEHERRSLGDGL